MVTKRAERIGLLILALILLVQVVANLGLLSTSAHSGQVAIPWMMNRGLNLFGQIWEQHAPLTSIIAAGAQRLLPFDPVDVDRLLNLILVLITTVLVYLLAYRLTDQSPVAGVVAAGWWFLWQPVFGNILFYFDAVLGALFCAALLVWVALGERRPRIAALTAGLMMGLATLAKQHAWAGVGVFALWLAVSHRRALWLYLVGALAFPLLAVIVTAAQGTLNTYLYWTYAYNLSGLMPGGLLNADLLRKLVMSSLFVPAFAALTLFRDRRGQRVLALLLWMSAAATLVPRIGDIHAVGQVSLAAVLTGVVVGVLIPPPYGWRVQWERLKGASAAALALGGIIAAALVVVAITAAAPYGSRPFGAPGIPANDEFGGIASSLQALADDDSTLYVLPLTDSTPQIFSLSGLMPPGTWVKGWSWYWDAPGASETLMGEWQQSPPNFVVMFPDLLVEGEPGILPFVDFVQSHYVRVETVPNVLFHGDAEIWKLNGG
jgi:hypothetical protein